MVSHSWETALGSTWGPFSGKRDPSNLYLYLYLYGHHNQAVRQQCTPMVGAQRARNESVGLDFSVINTPP